MANRRNLSGDSSQTPMPPRSPDRASEPQRSKRPDFYQLAIFLKVVETRSFAGTARLMARTQPAISQAIARLENIYGGNLFERRRGARLELTPIGEAILPSARALLETVDHQMLSAVQTAVSLKGTLRLGFRPGLAAGPLRAGVADFISACPDIRLRMVEGGSQELQEQLASRRIDLIIVASSPTLADPDAVKEALWSERLVAAMCAGDSLAHQGEIAWADLATKVILIRASPADVAIRRIWQSQSSGERFDCRPHAVSRETLLGMVGIGMGMTIVSESELVPHRDVVFRGIDGDKATITFDAVWAQGDGNPARHRLLECIRRQCRSVRPGPLTLLFPAKAPAPDHG